MKTTKAIKINAANTDAIEAVLHAANGRASGHTYTTASEILALAKQGNKELHNLLANKKLMKGATFTARSGDGLPSSYKYSRICTQISIKCFGWDDWRLISVQSVTAYRDYSHPVLTLTETQDERAIAILRCSYRIKQAA